MKVVTKEFARAARRNGVSDHDLRGSLDDADRGLIEADIGNCLVKQRLARQGAGKSGGFRVVIYYRRRERAVFLHLFTKNDKGSLGPNELEAYRDFAKVLDGLTDPQIAALVERRGWRVLGNAGQDEELPK